ncbi:unnamed protein product [Caenorhabditis angaria]|uniref:Ctg-1-like C-terminal domain-containing protein n=1 Tax=Caenorhabditis angaria TaxID=860376 RepID=A0A9P1N6D1_9PELO|nr:unnamed protein product [Caenorhabditis angaria]
MPVPKEVYWKPKEHHPPAECLHKITIPASKSRTLVYKVDKPNTLILMYSHNEADITITLYYSKEKNPAENELELMVAAIPKCGLPAMDLFDYMCEEPGYYHLRLTNEASWLLPSSYKLIILENGTRKEIEAVNMNEKWVKKANKKMK